MTDKQLFFLHSNQVRLNCLEFIKELPTDDKNPLVVKIQPMTRSLEQNYTQCLVTLANSASLTVKSETLKLGR